MAINKKLIHFKTKENFQNQLENGNILDTSICFIKDTKEIWTHGQLYNCDLEGTKEEIYEQLTPIFDDIYRIIGMRSHIGEDGEIIVGDDLKLEMIDEFIAMLALKVDKIDGKQLSTEDFTTILKNKLDSLENYDDTEIQTKLAQLKTNLDTILDSENTTAVIDTFQEIESFLQGITNTETLTGLLQDLKSDIMALCASTYLPLSGGTISSSIYGALNVKREVGGIKTGVSIKYSNSDEVLGYIGLIGTDSSDSIPYFAPSTTSSYKIFHEGNDGPDSGLDADLLDGKQGGEYALFKYDLTTSDNLYKTIGYGHTATDSVWKEIGPVIGFGANNLYHKLINGQNTTNTLHLKTCNNGTYSDWREFAFTDSNVASADKLTTKHLTNEDLNDIKDINFSSYYADSGSNVSNAPNDMKQFFHLQSYRTAAGDFMQIATTAGGNIYKRHFNGTNWSSWKKMLTEDDLTSLTNRITALESKVN